MPGSRVESDILDLFSKEKRSFTISQIAQLTGHDRRTVAHHLALLHQSRNLGMIQHGVRKKYFVPDNVLLISRSLCAHIILVINQDYSIRWINDPFLEVLGCTRNDIPHITLTHLEEIFPAINFKSILSHLVHGQTRFIKESCEYNGEQFTYRFSFSAIYIQDEPQSFIITGQDITENERIKSEYQKKEQSYEILIRNIPGIVFRRNILSNTIELFSDKVYFINKSIPLDSHPSCISFFDSFIHPDDRDRLIGVLQYAVFHQEEYEVEFRVINSHGYEFHFLERGRPILDPSNNTQYIDAIIMDITSLRKTTELLAESEERFRKLADVAPVGIYITDSSGNLQFVNHEWCRQHNITQNHAIGMPWTQGIHPDDRKLFSADNSESSQAYKRIIYRTNPGNAGCTWIHGISVPIEDREGTITGYIGCDTDISEWKRISCEERPFEANDALFDNQADIKRVMYDLQFHKIQLELINNELARTRDELEESLAHYIELYDNAPIGYLSLNQNGFIKKINLAGAAILGKERLAVLDTPLYSYISEISSQVFWDFFSHLSPGESDNSCFLHLHRPFHDSVVVHVTASINASGNEIHLVLIDITEKHRAELRLRESEKALARSQMIAQVGSWYLDLYSGQMTWSDEVYRLFGIPPGDPVRYDTVFEMIHPEDQAKVQAAYSAIQEGTDLKQLDHRIIRQDTGEVRFVHEWCVHERSPDNTIIRTFGVIQDITKQKVAEEKIKEQEAFQQLLIQLATKVINVSIDRIDPTLQEMMAAIGNFTHVDRVYIFHNDNERKISRNTHEWCAPGIKPEIENLQAVPFDFFPDIMDMLQQGGPAYIPDVSKMDPSEPARAILESQGIKSLILLPFIQDGDCTGFVGFDAVKERRRYSDTEISLLKVFAEIISNVLSREETEKALHEHEKVLAITQDIAQIGSWSHDARSGKLTWSDKTCEIFQVDPKNCAFTFDAYLEMVHPDDRDLVARIYTESREKGLERHELEYRIIQRESRDIRYIYDQGIHERDRDGTIVRSYGMIQDITRRKLAETALEESNRKLRILTRLTRDDVSSMLREIRQYLDLAKEEHDTQKISRYLQMARDMSSIIEKTLDFTRDYELSGVSYSGWLNLFQTISTLIHALASHQVVIENTVSPVLEIYADPMMRNVFMIILEYALKKDRGVSRLRISVTMSGRTLILICEDNGAGIPADEKEIIFMHGNSKYSDTRLFLVREILGITGLPIRECGDPEKGVRVEISFPEGRYRT